MHNSLSQILIKFTTPGIPDLYQGNESWRFDLVDPDNRRPVDYQKLSGLVSNESLSKLLGHWQDGRIKYNLTRQLLALREQYKPLVEGNYKSLMIKGQFSDNVIAFQRAHEDATLIILANRWLSRLINPGEIWNSERLTENNLHGIAQGQYISLLSHDTWDSVDNQLDLGKVLRHLPFEILLKR